MIRALLVFAVAASLCRGVFASQDAPTHDELLQTVDHIQAIEKDAIAERDQEKTAHAQVSQQLADSQKSFSDYKTSVQDTVTKANDAIADHDHIMGQLHLAKWIMSALAIAAVAFGALQIPPPFSIYIGGAAAIGAVSAIWTFL